MAIRSLITCDITIISLCISTVTGLAYTEAPSYMYTHTVHACKRATSCLCFSHLRVRLSNFVAQALHMFKNEIIASITHLGEEIEGVSKTIHSGPLSIQ